MCKPANSKMRLMRNLLKYVICTGKEQRNLWLGDQDSNQLSSSSLYMCFFQMRSMCNVEVRNVDFNKYPRIVSKPESRAWRVYMLMVSFYSVWNCVNRIKLVFLRFFFLFNIFVYSQGLIQPWSKFSAKNGWITTDTILTIVLSLYYRERSVELLPQTS